MLFLFLVQGQRLIFCLFTAQDWILVKLHMKIKSKIEVIGIWRRLQQTGSLSRPPEKMPSTVLSAVWLRKLSSTVKVRPNIREHSTENSQCGRGSSPVMSRTLTQGPTQHWGISHVELPPQNLVQSHPLTLFHYWIIMWENTCKL